MSGKWLDRWVETSLEELKIVVPHGTIARWLLANLEALDCLVHSDSEWTRHILQTNSTEGTAMLSTLDWIVNTAGKLRTQIEEAPGLSPLDSIVYDAWGLDARLRKLLNAATPSTFPPETRIFLASQLDKLRIALEGSLAQ